MAELLITKERRLNKMPFTRLFLFDLSRLRLKTARLEVLLSLQQVHKFHRFVTYPSQSTGLSRHSTCDIFGGVAVEKRPKYRQLLDHCPGRKLLTVEGGGDVLEVSLTHCLLFVL